MKILIPRDEMDSADFTSGNGSKKGIATIVALVFPPDMGGGATRAMNIAKCLINQGYEVRVVTSLPHYPNGLPLLKSLHSRRESIGELKVVRLPTLGLPHRGIVNRFIIYTWFAILSALALRTYRGSTTIISTGPHPFTDISSYLAKIAAKSSLVVDVSDLWPETWIIRNLIANALFQGVGIWINRIVYGHLSDRLSILNERALSFLIKRYNINKQCVVVYNPVDTNAFTYDIRSKIQKENLKAILGKYVEDRFVVLYHGLIGHYQNIETIIDAASIEERKLGKALFIIVGEGERKETITQYARSKESRNVVFLPRMSREQTQRIVAESNLGLVPIVYKQNLIIHIAMPVKTTEFLASGTPVLVPKGSFIGKIVTEAQAGFEVDFSDPMSIFEALKKALDDGEMYGLMARHARQLAVDHLSIGSISRAIQSIMTN